MMHPLIWVMGPMLLKKRISWKFVSWLFGDPSGDFFGWGDGDGGGKVGWEFSKEMAPYRFPCWRNLFVNSGVAFQSFEYLDLVNFQSLFARCVPLQRSKIMTSHTALISGNQKDLDLFATETNGWTHQVDSQMLNIATW